MILKDLSPRKLSAESDSPLLRKISFSSTYISQIEQACGGFGDNFIESMKLLRTPKAAQYHQALLHLQKLQTITKTPQLLQILKTIRKNNLIDILKDGQATLRNQTSNANIENKQSLALEYFTKGKKEIESGKLEEGLAHLIRAVENCPAEKSYRYNLAVVYGKLKMHEEALSHLSIILREDPEVIQVYRKKGDCLHALQRYEEAVQVYKQGLLVKPEDPACIAGIKRSSLRLIKSPTRKPLSPQKSQILSKLRHKLSNPNSLTPQQLKQISHLITKRVLKFPTMI